MAKELENNYLAAAINALNTLLTSDVTPRMASKIARFRKVLKEYEADLKQVETDFEGGAKDANGNEIADIQTV